MGDGEHALDIFGMLRMPSGRETKKRVDGSETGIAGSNAVATFAFQMLEEVGYCGRTEVREVKTRGFLSTALANESEEQAEAPTIRDNRVWAGVALLRKPSREESLEGRCNEAHAGSPSCDSSRWPTRASSSGVVDRYQYV